MTRLFLGLITVLFMAPALAVELKTVDQAAQAVAKVARGLEKRGDRRALFAKIYSLTIAASSQGLKRGEFRNPEWVKTLVVNYAKIYLRTISHELRGEREKIPLAWQEEFEYVDSTDFWTPDNYGVPLWSAALDVVYGINVHIKRDLVEALLLTPTNFNSASVRQDFLRITETLRSTMPRIWSVYMQYEQQISFGLNLQGPLMMNWIARLRAEAWENARSVRNSTPAQKEKYLNSLDEDVAWESRRYGIFLLF